MKKIFILTVAVMATASAYSQKAKLDEFYKSKKPHYSVPAQTNIVQVSPKEAMKMDVVKYSRTLKPSTINETGQVKFMALSKKEQMKREVLKINSPNIRYDIKILTACEPVKIKDSVMHKTD